MSDLQRQPGESQVAYDRRRAQAAGRQGRQAARNQPQPQNSQVAADRAAAVRRGEEGRAIPELRGALRRVSATNKLSLTPPPANRGQAENAKAMQDANMLNRVLKGVDRARGRQTD